ncbi:MAG: chromosome segregation protein SMC [Acidobacteria bacterium 13_1_40CM_3_56_11]|nr:MAG: chromosome segregation protein SMC [Acidobacteria bacterium 13_1_40CM_3_56_11]
MTTKGDILLKLRKVEIVGFKSFCERTVVAFSGSGTTCIVGPNGCGKSNVVDAISWVLGEQSHKSLRAERMADCIFNGTTKRPPLGLAEVTITMEDPELAEAARFVMESAASDTAADSESLITENSEPCGLTDTTTEILSLDPAQAPETQEAATDDSALVPAEPGGKFKRKKKQADKPVLAMKPGEVVVSRRLYRSGQSEYLINGRVGRLRDIQEMFMGVGLGPDSYAIIEQGRIGLILSTKPMERRAIIEEAAGVTKFKTKKRLAEAKLESSKVNLSRVNDIVVEVEKQLGSLKRQAAKARRYSEIREQMRGIVRQMLAGKARELDAEAERISKQLQELSASELQRATAIQQQEGEQDRLNQRIYELDAETRQNQNVLNLTALEVDRSENRIAFNRQRAGELAGRHAKIDAELAQATAQAVEWESRSASQIQAVTLLREESGTLTARVEELANRAESRAAQISESEARIDALRRSSSEAGESLLRLHGEQKQAEEALVHQAEALRKLEATEHDLLETSMRARDDAERAAFEHESATSQLHALKQNAAELQAKIAGFREQRDALSQESGALRDSLAGVRARHSTLTQILNDRSYTADAVQKLFAANERGGGQNFRAVGVLADYAEVEEQHEAAIEQYLRDELEYVVVETYDHARAGVSMLRDEVGGRATFFVDSLRNLRLSSEYEPIVNFRAEDGVISRLDKLVEFRDPLGAAAKQFLPRLRSAYLTDSATAAEKLSQENSQYAFVTPDGTCYQGRMVTGGRPDEVGPLGMKRELRALDAEVMQLEHKMQEKQAALELVGTELRSTEQALTEIDEKQREADREAISAMHRHGQMQSELARLGLELTICQNELARIRLDVENARQRAERAKNQHTAAALSRAEADAESARLAEALVLLRGSIQSEQNELAAARAKFAAMNERLMAAEALSTRLNEERAELERREAALQQQVTSILDETSALGKQSEDLALQLEGLRGEKLRLEIRQRELEQEWDAARTRVTQMEDHLRMSRQSLQELREQRSHAEVDRAKNDSDRQHLRETCMSEVNAQPEDLIATEAAFMSGEELAIAETNYREMKQRIESMGPVNMMALEEFNECDQRFTFLTRERDDLLQSIADTQQAIAELDLATKEKFEHAFHAINKSFSEAFHTIFGGGMAEMRLTEPDSSGDAGIDIVASPPGKRLQNVLLLSGGEKAMTALALLIAIFRYQPSPFCILDEVDAPLDEANVGRFTRLIGEMSGQTQFIIVTHNRKTMEMGSVLYGVTMQEPGVSKLVSVRWEESDASDPKQKAAAASAA